MHKDLGRSISGELSLDSEGVLFEPAKGTAQRWSALTDIKSLDLRPHLLIITGYENRRRHLPMAPQFKFTLQQNMTPAVAAQLVKSVPRPVRNRIPDPSALATTVLAVRRDDHFGGSNGLLRIREDGIDYVTAQAGQSRSWRWADLQTLSHPDPFHLFVSGYSDNYAFDLKQPLSRELFNSLSDRIWIQNDDEPTPKPAVPYIQPLPYGAPR